MADIKIKSIEPYTNIPYIPFGQVEQTTRHGAQYFSNVKQLQVGFGSSVFRVDRDGMWAGAETFAAAPWKVDWDGNMTASSITLTGYIPTGGALTDIGSGNITSTYIGSNAVVSSKIAANAVTADKISVSSLSAISANIGSVTSGTITGALIRTSSSGARVEIDDSVDSIKIYDASDLRLEIYDNFINFNEDDGTQIGSIYAGNTGNMLINVSQTGNSLLLNVATSGSIIMSVATNTYITLGSGKIDFNTYLDLSSYWIDNCDGIYFDDHNANPDADGHMVYYDVSGVEGIRCQFGGSDFQFDATGV